MPTQESIAEAKSHLKTALIQVLPSDDEIIVEHMVQAYLALGGGLNDFLSERPFVAASEKSAEPKWPALDPESGDFTDGWNQAIDLCQHAFSKWKRRSI